LVVEREDSFEYEDVWRVDCCGLFEAGVLLEGVDGYFGNFAILNVF
jgi:hypothetical protein